MRPQSSRCCRCAAQIVGHSCYIASTLQALFALAPFQQRYLEAFAEHPHICDKISPAECTECQISKVADGLLSGQYARVEAHADDASGKRFQVGIRPMMFKSLIGKGHSEFSTMRQQDADEFIRHLLKTMAKDAKALRKTDPASTFAFETETRLQCTKCLKVRYRREAQDIASVPVTAVELPRTDDGPLQYETVSMRSCFDLMTAAGDLEYNCPTCREQVVASQCVTELQLLCAAADSLTVQNDQVRHVPRAFDRAGPSLPARQLGASEDECAYCRWHV